MYSCTLNDAALISINHHYFEATNKANFRINVSYFNLQVNETNGMIMLKKPK